MSNCFKQGHQGVLWIQWAQHDLLIIQAPLPISGPALDLASGCVTTSGSKTHHG